MNSSNWFELCHPNVQGQITMKFEEAHLVTIDFVNPIPMVSSTDSSLPCTNAEIVNEPNEPNEPKQAVKSNRKKTKEKLTKLKDPMF